MQTQERRATPASEQSSQLVLTSSLAKKCPIVRLAHLRVAVLWPWECPLHKSTARICEGLFSGNGRLKPSRHSCLSGKNGGPSIDTGNKDDREARKEAAYHSRSPHFGCVGFCHRLCRSDAEKPFLFC